MYKINDIVKHTDPDRNESGYSICKVERITEECYHLHQLCYVEYCGGEFENCFESEKYIIEDVDAKELELIYRPEINTSGLSIKIPYEIGTKLYYKANESDITIYEVTRYELTVTNIGTILTMTCQKVGSTHGSITFTVVGSSIMLPSDKVTLSTNINDLA